MPSSRVIEGGRVEITTFEARGHVYRVVSLDDEPPRAPTPLEAAETAKHAFEPATTTRTRLRRQAKAEAESAA